MIELRVRCAVREAARVGEALTALGWGTLWIEEPLAQRTDDDGYVLDAPPPDAPAVVHAWATNARARVPARVLGFAIERRDAPDEGAVDWTTEWRRGHALETRIAPGWVLVPPWHAGERASGERAIVIEPGGAFGTGEHPTTRHSLELLYGALRAGARVLDLGTGSGVLAIAAALWGAQTVLAVDLQPDAADHVAHNVALNPAVGSVVEARVEDLRETLARAATRWDVVLCNVGSAELLRALEAGLARAVEPGGVLIASGIYAPSEARVLTAARAAGLEPDARREDDRWVTRSFRRATRS